MLERPGSGAISQLTSVCECDGWGGCIGVQLSKPQHKPQNVPEDSDDVPCSPACRGLEEDSACLALLDSLCLSYSGDKQAALKRNIHFYANDSISLTDILFFSLASCSWFLFCSLTDFRPHVDVYLFYLFFCYLFDGDASCTIDFTLIWKLRALHTVFGHAELRFDSQWHRGMQTPAGQTSSFISPYNNTLQCL